MLRRIAARAGLVMLMSACASGPEPTAEDRGEAMPAQPSDADRQSALAEVARLEAEAAKDPMLALPPVPQVTCSACSCPQADSPCLGSAPPHPPRWVRLACQGFC